MIEGDNMVIVLDSKATTSTTLIDSLMSLGQVHVVTDASDTSEKEGVTYHRVGETCLGDEWEDTVATEMYKVCVDTGAHLAVVADKKVAAIMSTEGVDVLMIKESNG